jgi:hypothetical protein
MTPEQFRAARKTFGLTQQAWGLGFHGTPTDSMELQQGDRACHAMR